MNKHIVSLVTFFLLCSQTAFGAEVIEEDYPSLEYLSYGQTTVHSVDFQKIPNPSPDWNYVLVEQNTFSGLINDDNFEIQDLRSKLSKSFKLNHGSKIKIGLRAKKKRLAYFRYVWK